MSTQKEHEEIMTFLQLLVSQNLLTSGGYLMDPERYQELQKQMVLGAQKIMRRYTDGREAAESEALSEQEREAFNKQVKNLAKALPGVTQGTLAAIEAFQREDPIRGSAALMDIGASVTPLIAGLSAAGGPPGMVVSAIFTMVSQILTFFAPAKPDLKSELDKLLRDAKADDKKRVATAANTDVTTNAVALRSAAVNANELLEAPTELTDKTFATQIEQKIKVVVAGIGDVKRSNAHASRDLWDVVDWLEEEGNQHLDAWPAVLAAWCQLYVEMRLPIAMVSLMANSDGMRRRFEEAEAAKNSELRNALMDVRVQAESLVHNRNAVADTAAAHNRNLVAPARNRGLLLQIDPSSSGNLYGGTNILEGRFPYLNAQGTRIAFAASEKDLTTASPTYHVFHLEGGDNGRTFHGLWRYPYTAAPAWRDLGDSLRGLTDIWATIGGGSKKEEIYFHGTKGPDIIGYVLDEKNNPYDGNYRRSLKTRATSVRVVRHPRWFADDPDAGVEGARLQANPYITYGGCEGSGDIFVDFLGSQAGYVASPWAEYRGLGVDSHYLWVFRAEGFACATHASVIRCRTEGGRPRWMEHQPNDYLYDQSYRAREKDVTRNRPPLKGVLDLSSCDDGTLVAAIVRRSVDDISVTAATNPYPVWSMVDGKPGLFTATYETDLQAARIALHWTRLPKDTTGVAVQKLPVTCWSMLESLEPSPPGGAATR